MNLVGWCLKFKSIIRDIKKITYRVDSRFVWDIYNIWYDLAYIYIYRVFRKSLSGNSSIFHPE